MGRIDAFAKKARSVTFGLLLPSVETPPQSLAPLAELMRLDATQPKLTAGELFTAVTPLPGCRSLHQLSSDLLVGSTKPIEPETEKAETRKVLGWLIEITPMVDPNETSVELECRIYENAPPRQASLSGTC